jgi:hypothetical protein
LQTIGDNKGLVLASDSVVADNIKNSPDILLLTDGGYVSDGKCVSERVSDTEEFGGWEWGAPRGR